MCHIFLCVVGGGGGVPCQVGGVCHIPDIGNFVQVRHYEDSSCK